MEEKKMQAVESGSLYMTLDAFYKPVISEYARTG